MNNGKSPWPSNSETKILPTHLFCRRGRIFYLFHALLAILLLFPYLETRSEKLPSLLLTITNLAVIGSIVWEVSINRRQRLVGLILGLPSLILCWIHIPITQKAALVLTTLLYVYTILLLLPFLVRSEKVGSEEIYGAISLYFLLGMAWGTIYQEIEWFYPESFQFIGYLQQGKDLIWSDYLFFSYTTLTTLGYGDIIPVSSNARSLAIVETTTGVVFLTVMVARIIGLSISRGVCHMLKDKNL